MAIKYYHDVIQYSEAWDKLKCGILSASKFCDILTPAKLEIADNKTSKELVAAIACQRILRNIEPTFQSYDMLRGLREEALGFKVYSDNYAPLQRCGFVTNDKWGFTLGCSPDGLVGDDGGWECKSKMQKLQFAIIRAGKMPDEFRLQVQATLMITERKWWDFSSYSGGMNMLTIRIEPDPVVIKAIETAAFDFETRVKAAMKEYTDRLADKNLRIVPVPVTPEGDEIITTEQEAA